MHFRNCPPCPTHPQDGTRPLQSHWNCGGPAVAFFASPSAAKAMPATPMPNFFSAARRVVDRARPFVSSSNLLLIIPPLVPVSVDPLERIFDDIRGNFASHLLPILASGPEMDAAKYARVPDFVYGAREARIVPGHTRYQFGCKRKGGLITKVSGQHRSRRPAGGRMTRWVFGMRRRD